MDTNRIILIILASLSLILSYPKIKTQSALLIAITIAVGFCVTKDIITSVCIGFILGNIYVSLNNIQSQNNVEGFKSNGKKKSKKSKSKKTKTSKESFGNDDLANENFSDSDVEEDFEIDTKNSFYENYKGLTKKQIKGLNSDTKDLMQTQKQLLETLKNMGPALKDGKQVLDTFKNYFGSDQDIGKAMQNFKVE